MYAFMHSRFIFKPIYRQRLALVSRKARLGCILLVGTFSSKGLPWVIGQAEEDAEEDDAGRKGSGGEGGGGGEGGEEGGGGEEEEGAGGE